MEKMVHTKRVGKVLEITFDRPPANAINRAASRALYAAFNELQEDPDLALGIITGAGERIFSGGWDLKEVATVGAAEASGKDPETGEGAGGFAGITEYWDLYKPVIAAVNGAAVGGGLELALGADIMIASENAFIALPEMQRGLLADAGAIQRLPRRIPYNVAMELLYTGRRMYADEAEKWGLFSKVVPADKLMETAHEIAAEIAHGAPLAMQALKEVMGAIESMPVREAMGVTKPGQSNLPMYEKMSNSEDFIEGPKAFAEKRTPVWKGR